MEAGKRGHSSWRVGRHGGPRGTRPEHSSLVVPELAQGRNQLGKKPSWLHSSLGI